MEYWLVYELKPERLHKFRLTQLFQATYRLLFLLEPTKLLTNLVYLKYLVQW